MESKVNLQFQIIHRLQAIDCEVLPSDIVWQNAKIFHQFDDVHVLLWDYMLLK